MTSQATPRTLRKGPLLEAIFEARFTTVIPAAGDVLPGLLYSTFREQYPSVEQLPLAGVPRKIRSTQESLIYQPSHRLHGGSRAVQVGDRVVSLSSTDYGSWTSFRSNVLEVLSALRATGIVGKVERFSFRYVNIIPMMPGEKQLSLLNLTCQLMGREPEEQGFTLRSEIKGNGLVTAVRITTNAVAKKDAMEVRGLLLDIDTITMRPAPDFFPSPDEALNEAHGVLEDVFFSLLAPQTLSRLDPEW